MKGIYLILISLSSLFAFSQSNPCKIQLDSTQVVEIARKNKAYWDNNPVFQPSIKFEQKACEWQVISIKTKHTNKGDCKNTNGCTEITTLTLFIDDATKKVKGKQKDVKLMPNYE